MSSNIRVNRICEYCQKEFVARTTVTKTCGDPCAKMLYKRKQKEEKIEASNKGVLKIKLQPLEDIKAKEFLTVKDAAKLLNCSRQTIYTLINSGRLKSANLNKKKTIIKRSSIDSIFI